MEKKQGGFLNSLSSQAPVLLILLLIASFLLGATTTKLSLQGKNNGQPAAQPSPSQSPKTKVEVSAGHFPVLGNKNAKVTLVEFADFRCPFCERFFTDTESQIIKDYVNTGKAKFAFRQFAFLGPASIVAANAAECANEQGKFWDFHNYLYKNQPPESDTSMYNVDFLTTAAGTLGLNTDQFKTCLSSNKYQKNVDLDLSDGQKAGVSGTPSVFVNGQIIVGAQPYSAFKTIIDQALTGK